MENKIIEARDYVAEIIDIIRSDISDKSVLEALEEYHDNDIAGAFEQLTAEERKRLFGVLGEEKLSEIFAYVDFSEEYINELGIKGAAKLLEKMDSDDAVDILDEVDDETEKKLVKLMDRESSRDIKLIRSYDEDEIGSRITTNFIEITRDLNVKSAMKSLVKQAGDNDNISTIYVSDEKGKFYGSMSLKDLIVAREHTNLEDIISTSYPYFYDHEKISDCLEKMKEYTEDSFPVLNLNDVIIGIITAQDIAEVIDEELSDDYAKLAGLTSEEEIDESVGISIKKRIPWLIILLILGLGVSAVVGMFESLVSQVALIVCFQSLILAMAGNVGTQSLAVTIRGLTEDKNQRAGLIFKEIRIGFFNGLILGAFSFVLVGGYIYFAKGYPLNEAFAVSGCVAAALVVSMVISALVGTCVPLLFDKLKIDPAVASGPLITTINDLVAVTLYYGISWVLLINIFEFV